MEHRCPQCGAALPSGVPAWARDLTVGQAMTLDPVTLGPEDSLLTAAETMRAKKIRRIPIVVGETLVGILAQGDLNRVQPSILTESQEDFHRVMEETSISRIMINKPITVAENVPLLVAAQQLHSTKFGALPVVREGRLVGILTDSDLHRQLVGLLEQAG